MTALEFITGHVIIKLHYNQIYQLKTTLITTGTPGLSDLPTALVMYSKSVCTLICRRSEFRRTVMHDRTSVRWKYFRWSQL